MPISRAKTAFQFFQAEMLGEVKKEMGAGTSMGDAMGELSRRWKSMADEDKTPYFEQETQDRLRFEKESFQADQRAAAEQRQRRNKLVVQDGEDASQRGARAKIDTERAEAEKQRRERKQHRMSHLSVEELEEKQRLQQQKKAETAERQRRREAEEKAVEARHKKLDKAEAEKAQKRLDYLLKQSSIFSKLKMGGGTPPAAAATAAADKKKSGAGSRKSSSSSSSHRRKKGRDDYDDEDAGDEGGEEEGDGEEEDSTEQHTFLTKQPPSIKFGTLKPYQLEGLNWMIHLMQKGLNGILADEMGLGKTLQSISVLAYQFDYLRIQGPHLVCVPKSTLSNWMNELNRWCPSLRPIKFHGNKDEKAALAERYFSNEAAAHDGKRPTEQVLNEETGEMEDDNSDNPREWDVCVTTYEVCNTEAKTLGKFAWRYLVIDEAHRLKNEASMFSKTVRKFTTAFRLLLTGTPLQNNLHELWALLNFLLPDIFSSAEQFDEWFDLDIDDEDAKKDMISQLHKILRPFMLRRLKSDVAKGLPPKTETLVMVGMSKMQKQLYKKLLLRDIDSLTGAANNKNKTAILNIVMQLRKCCGHPYLFEGMEDRSLDPLGEHLVENCGKLNMVDKLLKKLKERGSRVLIFTQMTRVLDILEDFMVMRGHQYCRIDGNTNYEDREEAIDSFNREGSEKFCFILSTRAGGLGINLQTADTCILYDSDWNPQADLQAQDRCHRLGQKKPVNVYRLVSESTVEEKIVERAQQKLKLDAMVVQQGRLKDKDKVSKEEIMAAVRFGAEVVFRSEESTITDDDIDVILERGAAKTKELAEKLQKADKGDMLDFRMDGGMSAQTFEGIDYSDRELRAQLRMLAADSMGKRERRPPPTNYNPIMTSTKSMVVNNRKIKLPRSLRLPRMEDHQFYNRERLLELGKLEFQTYAALKQMGQLPSKEVIDKSRTLLPSELAQEKIELLDEGFGTWTRSQYFQFVKAATKFGRDDIQSISSDMDMPMDAVAAYSKAFWKYGSTELKSDEWERVKANVEKGEQKIAKKRKLSALLTKFIGTFKDPRTEMTFANKGTAHFTVEQDRALLCSVEKNGYGNWDAVREELRVDDALLFQHTVQGMNADVIGKRCDYRLRQMERELEVREKKLKQQKPPNVLAAERAIGAIKEMEVWEREAMDNEMRGQEAPSLHSLSEEAREVIEERLSERQALSDRLREIEVQVRGCKEIAKQTRESILRGAQYVNYSNITLKAGGQNAGTCASSANSGKGVQLEARLNRQVLRVSACGECPACLDPDSRKLCAKRLEVRNQLIRDAAAEPDEPPEDGKKGKKGSKKRSLEDIAGQPPAKRKGEVGKMAGKGALKKSKLPGESAKAKPRAFSTELPRIGNPLGNKKMEVPEEVIPVFCRRIGVQGTTERKKCISDLVEEFPVASLRQVTLKFSELTTQTRPEHVKIPEKKVAGRVFRFFLRPRFYHMLPAEERPDGWEKYAKEDEALWKKQQKEKSAKESKTSGAATKKESTPTEPTTAVEATAEAEEKQQPPKKKKKTTKQPKA